MIFPTTQYIKSINIRPSKKFSQNFLVDQNIAAKVVSCAEITPEDTVIEIGPGLGSLSYYLLQCNAPTIFFELDRNLFARMQAELENRPDSTVINKDILKVRFTDHVDQVHKAVLFGSIPFAITTPIILKCLQESAVIKKMVFIMQKEVAERICARPGTREYGVLSVLSTAYTDASIQFIIPSNCFYPKPRVASAVIEIVPLTTRCWNDEREALFRKIVKASFSQRRKTLANCLKPLLKKGPFSIAALKDAALAQGIDLGRRAETLSIDEFDTITAVISRGTAP